MADPHRIQGFLTGYVETSPIAGQVIAACVATAPAVIRTVMVEADTGGSTTSAIVDLRINGVSAYTNPANRPSLGIGQTGKFLAPAPDRSAVQPYDRVTLVVVQNGNKAQIIATAALEMP